MKHLFILLPLLGACPPAPIPPPGPDADAGPPWQPPPAPDAATQPPLDATFAPDPGGTPVARACEALRWLGCPEGLPTPGGRTCENVYTAVRGFPGLVFEAEKIADCREITCARRNGVKCGGK